MLRQVGAADGADLEAVERLPMDEEVPLHLCQRPRPQAVPLALQEALDDGAESNGGLRPLLELLRLRIVAEMRLGEDRLGFGARLGSARTPTRPIVTRRCFVPIWYWAIQEREPPSRMRMPKPGRSSSKTMRSDLPSSVSLATAFSVSFIARPLSWEGHGKET